MSVIRIEDLTFSYPSGTENVFEHISFQLDSDWKLGFIGRNGRGKTTLLKLLAGEYPYRGKIVSSVSFRYFPYPVRDKGKSTEEVLAEVSPDVEEWRRLRELSLLGVDENCLKRPFETLSNGEQTKVLFASLFCNEDRFLLIDEPTNHLDLRAREQVSSYLNKKKGFIVVSHDRSFLDGCIDHVLSLNRAGIEVCSGNCSSYLRNFAQQQERERRQNDKLQGEIRRLQESKSRTAGWADAVEKSKFGTLDSGLKADRGYVGHKSAKMMKRAKSIEQRQERAIEQKSALLKNTEVESPLKLMPLSYRSERLVTFSDVVPYYGERAVCAPLSFCVGRGERIALEGRNGCGKSSILKLLCGEDIAHTGSVEKGSGLVISYVPQGIAHLKGSLHAFAAEKGIETSLLFAILHKMGFRNEHLEADLSSLSDGQKKKVLLAGSLSERAHLYIWDEPLNFIDLLSRIQIEELIEEFQPTMLFVEHDKAFTEHIATRIVHIKAP